MNEVEQKTFDMTLQEFREYQLPQGWEFSYISGRTDYSGQVVMHVILGKATRQLFSSFM